MDGQLHDYYERIEKLEKELYGSYNEAGGFYERETNDYISATYINPITPYPIICSPFFAIISTYMVEFHDSCI